MGLITIDFTASPTSAVVTRYVQEGSTIGEYLSDVEGISSTKDVNVEVNGTTADLTDDLEDGMSIAISQKKTASGLPK